MNFQIMIMTVIRLAGYALFQELSSFNVNLVTDNFLVILTFFLSFGEGFESKVCLSIMHRLYTESNENFQGNT